MSQENVQIVARLYRAAERGDWWAYPQAFDPDVRSARVMSPETEGAGLSGEWQGLDGLAENLRLWFSAWNGFRSKPEEFIEAGDKVVVLTRETATGKASGLPLDQDAADVWELRDGKVVDVCFYLRREDALEAAGLRE
jgi:ketosteroid isomerase-like protein